MMSRAKDSHIDLLLEYYPDDQSAGSPFDTGGDNVFSRFSCTSRQLIETDADYQAHNPSVLRLFKEISFSIARVDFYCRTWLEGRNHGDLVRV